MCWLWPGKSKVISPAHKWDPSSHTSQYIIIHELNIFISTSVFWLFDHSECRFRNVLPLKDWHLNKSLNVFSWQCICSRLMISNLAFYFSSWLALCFQLGLEEWGRLGLQILLSVAVQHVGLLSSWLMALEYLLTL